MKCCLAGFVVLLCQAQQQLPPELELLAKIKAQVAENLRGLPNFTCTETIQRSLQYKSTATPEMVDTVRLEIAFVQGKELFGWPGAARIDEPDIGKLVSGSVGNGYFALFLNNIFLVSSTTFHSVGSEELEGKQAIRYDYRVPKEAGAYRLRSARGAALIGYHGSFWVADGTVDLLRINVIADQVPTELGYAAATSLLDYAPTVIGGRTFPLPRAAEFVVNDTDGNEHRSILSFKACREFVGESTVKFNVPVSGPAVALPDDFTVDLDLITPIDSATAAGGDPIHATLRDNIEVNHTTVVPAGATLAGRIAHFVKNGHSYTLDFTFTFIDFEGGHADLSRRTNEALVENWARIRLTPQFNLAHGTRLTLHSQLARTGK